MSVITREQVVGSDWCIYWMLLDGGREHMPFGTIEVLDQYGWEPLFGDIEAVAAAVGNSRKMWLVIEKE
jgi:hypothetical protein